MLNYFLRFFRIGDTKFRLPVISVCRYDDRNNNHSFIKHASDRTACSIIYNPHNAGGNGEESEILGVFYTERYGCAQLSCNGKQREPAAPCDYTYTDHYANKTSRNNILCAFLFKFFCKNQISYTSYKVCCRSRVSA